VSSTLLHVELRRKNTPLLTPLPSSPTIKSWWGSRKKNAMVVYDRVCVQAHGPIVLIQQEKDTRQLGPRGRAFCTRLSNGVEVVPVMVAVFFLVCE
jgi:hypothetical protein